MLAKNHPSILRNPLIAGACHRTGAVEVWGRGTNRVMEACHAHGIAPPELADEAGVVTVTFRVTVVPEALRVPSTSQVQVLEIAELPKTLLEPMAPSGLRNERKGLARARTGLPPRVASFMSARGRAWVAG
jgi:predicted HTH transcriptional regulator